MTPEQIRLVQASWSRVQPVQAAAAELFYSRLFEIAPDTRALFRRDMHAQGAMLMRALDLVVDGLARPDELLPAARALARRHVGYGVQPAHYAQVGAALLWTLEEALGADFTPELRQAWADAYGVLSGAMQQAAWPAAAAQGA